MTRRSLRRRLLLGGLCLALGTVALRWATVLPGWLEASARDTPGYAPSPESRSGLTAPRSGLPVPRSASLSSDRIASGRPPWSRAQWATARSDAEAPARDEPAPLARRHMPLGGGSLHLLAAERPHDGLLQRAAGVDLAAPRDLVLWQLDEAAGRAAAVAYGTSASDGRFAFERLLLADAGAMLVVTAGGSNPFAPGASLPLESPPRRPPPPLTRANWLADGEGDAGWDLEVWAAPGARLWISPASRLDPLPAESVDSAQARLRRIPWPAPPQADPWLIAQELPDGRRSPWSPIAPPEETLSGSPQYEQEHELLQKDGEGT